MSDLEAGYEVVVVGAGNAGLAAALSAAEHGAKAALLEKASEPLRGGNIYFTRGSRFAWNSLEDDILPLIPHIAESEIKQLRDKAEPYTQGRFYDDVMLVSEGRSDPALLQMLVSESLPTVKWLREMGHEWTPDVRPDASHAVLLNGGRAGLSDRGFGIAARRGVDVRFENIAMELLRDSRGRVSGVRALTPQGFTRLHAKAVILASGGFEADPALRATFLGPGWETARIRGVPFNTGDGLRMAWDIGAQSCGQLSGCHASPQDVNHPPYCLRTQPMLQYRRNVYPWCITVNIDGRRFMDEGSDFRPYTYAKFGRFIMSQPQAVAFQIMDDKIAHLLKDYGKATGGKADTLEALAIKLGLEPGPLIDTIQEYNKAVQPGTFNHKILDGKRTAGLAINKSNWAMTIDTPPFQGYVVCGAVTFTFGGLRINTEAQVMSTWEAPIPGLYACGEIVEGVFYSNYPGCSGMMQGAVFGRKAGLNVARIAKGCA